MMDKLVFLTCSKCSRPYEDYSVRHCKHRAVNKAYGEYICVYCCRKCKYNEFEYGGQKCRLKELESELCTRD